MNYNKMIDHTVLKADTPLETVKRICDEAMEYGFASVCINPCHVAYCADYLKDSNVNVCTVIGFPNGYNTTDVKIFETENALKNGADEIDMVINLGDLMDKNYDNILSEITKIKAVCGTKILKVIIETCLLNEEQKIKMCEIVTKSGADFIKTSTGFSTGGATFEDIELFAKYVGKNIKIKAAGGISSIADAEKFISLGADRLGTSRIVKIVKSNEI